MSKVVDSISIVMSICRRLGVHLSFNFLLFDRSECRIIMLFSLLGFVIERINVYIYKVLIDVLFIFHPSFFVQHDVDLGNKNFFSGGGYLVGPYM